MVAGVALLACSPPRENRAARVGDGDSSRPAPATGAVVFLGTSLTAGFGVAPEEAYPARIQQKIDSAGLPYRVINAGESGGTTAGGVRRLDWVLRQPVRVLVIELGANDALRGQDLDSTRTHLQTIIDRTRAAWPDARIVLAGMQAPPNLGRRYADAFRALFPELARQNDVALIPFLLESVGGVAEFNQADGIHPTAQGHALMAETVWTVLRPVLASRETGNVQRETGKGKGQP